jgi:hypothetical protein
MSESPRRLRCKFGLKSQGKPFMGRAVSCLRVLPVFMVWTAVGLSTVLGVLTMGPSAFAQGSLLDAGKSLLNNAAPNATPNATSGGASKSGAGLSASEIAGGLKDALRVGTERTVAKLGKPDGFLKDQDVHIPLPGALGQAQSMLKSVGAGGLTEDLETRINRAAEDAAPKARDIFVKAVQAMSIQDAQGLLNGPKDAATQYFKRETTQPLTTAMRPVIDKSLADAGAVKALDGVKSKVAGLPMGSAVNLDLTGYVLEKALAGLFLYIAREEAAIRDNPAQRSTELLKKVFG